MTKAKKEKKIQTVQPSLSVLLYMKKFQKMYAISIINSPIILIYLFMYEFCNSSFSVLLKNLFPQLYLIKRHEKIR